MRTLRGCKYENYLFFKYLFLQYSDMLLVRFPPPQGVAIRNPRMDPRSLLTARTHRLDRRWFAQCLLSLSLSLALPYRTPRAAVVAVATGGPADPELDRSNRRSKFCSSSPLLLLYARSRHRRLVPYRRSPPARRRRGLAHAHAGARTSRTRGGGGTRRGRRWCRGKAAALAGDEGAVWLPVAGPTVPVSLGGRRGRGGGGSARDGLPWGGGGAGSSHLGLGEVSFLGWEIP